MLVYGGIIIVAGQLLWYKGIATSNASQVSLASSFTPVAGVIFAVFLFGETPSQAILIGGAIIVTGIAIAIAQIGPIIERRVKSCQTCEEALKLEAGVNFKGV